MNQLRSLADEYYLAGKYVEAIDFYTRIHELDPTDQSAHVRLALSCLNSLKYDEAEKHFLTISQNANPSDEVVYNYGFLVKMNGEYKKADSIFKELSQLPDLTDKYRDLGEFQQEGCRLGIRQLKVKNPHNLRPMTGVNSKDHDFGATESKNGVVAISTNRNTNQRQFYDGQLGTRFPNMLLFSKTENEWDEINDIKKLNTEWGEGTGDFTTDGSGYYFTSCKKETGCQIYYAKLVAKNEFHIVSKLDEDVNLKGYDSKQPNISASGDTLFFVSNRPDGHGGTDIWMSIQLRPGDWSAPINMGPDINTAADEMSPFYSSKFSGLMFSSNGHAGYGGFDIYLAKGKSFYFPNIYNAGPPFNTPLDDTYFFVRNNGYLTSNRGTSDFDVFEFQFDDEVALLKSFMTQESLIDLVLQESSSLDLHAFRMEEFEGYNLFQPMDLEQTVTLRKNNFFKIIGSGIPESVIRLNLSDTSEMLTLVPTKEQFEIRMLPDTLRHPNLTQNKIPIDFIYEPMNFEGHRYDFEKIYFDFDSDQLRAESQETLKDLIKIFRSDNVVMVDIHTHTDHFGDLEYNYSLSERRGLSIVQFLESNGLNYNQLRVFPNGEKSPISGNDKWYSRLSDRRAEIIVYTRSPVSFAKPEIFIVRKDISFENISKSLAISRTKLYDWNGINREVKDIKEGHILRVFDPQHLEPNYQFLIPEKDAGREIVVYKVKARDTLRSIAEAFGTIEEIIMDRNHLTTSRIKVGQEIIIFK